MLLNRQRRVRVAEAGLERFLARACRAARVPPESVTVCLVTNSQISRWNRAYRHKPGFTDVLSFPANRNQRRPRTRAWKGGITDGGGAGYSYLGDVAIAPAVARRNAVRFGRTFGDEMRILILHGMLHLMGYDHETDKGQMDRREQALRREHGLA